MGTPLPPPLFVPPTALLTGDHKKLHGAFQNVSLSSLPAMAHDGKKAESAFDFFLKANRSSPHTSYLTGEPPIPQQQLPYGLLSIPLTALLSQLIPRKIKKITSPDPLSGSELKEDRDS